MHLVGFIIRNLTRCMVTNVKLGGSILQVLLDGSETMFLSSRPLHFVNVQ
jgi:hypothetical protein